MGRDDFRETSLKAWGKSLDAIFPNGIPSSARWTDHHDIAKVLNIIGAKPNSNHAFFPTGGGLDLEGAAVLEQEPDYVSLKTGNRGYEVVIPAALLFESFGPELEWAYFRLECDTFPQTDVYDEPQGETEEVGCLGEGKYVSRSDWDAGEHRGRRLPDSTLLLVRRIGGGPIVVVCKGCT